VPLKEEEIKRNMKRNIKIKKSLWTEAKAPFSSIVKGVFRIIEGRERTTNLFKR